MLTTSVKIGNKYNYTEEKIEQALTFLRTTDFTGMEPGKVAIDGDRIFAEIQEYTTKDPKDCRFETHRKYYDIQYVAEGEEFFGYIPLSELEEDTGYDETRDLEFYKEPENPGWIHLRKGDLAIVSPEDGHKPRCIGDAPCKVKKIVVKVLVES